MVNRVKAISFYQKASKSSLRRGEEPQTGWQRQTIYSGRHMVNDLGCASSFFIIKLSDGRIIATNDLWNDTSFAGWSTHVPNGALVGASLETNLCGPMSKEDLTCLVNLICPRSSENYIFVRSDLTDKQAYEMRGMGRILPKWKSRSYSDSTVFCSFSSPEGAQLTHFKVGHSPVQPLRSKEQLLELNPSTNNPVYVFYGDGSGLQRGDTIDERYVYDLPGW